MKEEDIKKFICPECAWECVEEGFVINEIGTPICPNCDSEMISND